MPVPSLANARREILGPERGSQIAAAAGSPELPAVARSGTAVRRNHTARVGSGARAARAGVGYARTAMAPRAASALVRRSVGGVRHRSRVEHGADAVRGHRRAVRAGADQRGARTGGDESRATEPSTGERPWRLAGADRKRRRAERACGFVVHHVAMAGWARYEMAVALAHGNSSSTTITDGSITLAHPRGPASLVPDAGKPAQLLPTRSETRRFRASRSNGFGMQGFGTAATYCWACRVNAPPVMKTTRPATAGRSRARSA